MLKLLRLSTTLIVILTIQISNTVLTSPVIAADIGTLTTQLKQAVCIENWVRAVEIIDQVIAATPASNQTQHSQLETYQEKMQNLSISRTNVYSWLESYCTAPVATSATSNIDVNSAPTKEQASN